jgi:predicted RNA-binding Zn-ribbon protein involved in translation (DUF1610 family)
MLYSWEHNGEYAPQWQCDHCGTIFPVAWGIKAERIKEAVRNKRTMGCSTRCMSLLRQTVPKVFAKKRGVAVVEVKPYEALERFDVPKAIGKKKQKAHIIGVGQPCPKCGKNMQRREPKNENLVKYYTEWDYCPSCSHIQHYNHYSK